MTPSDYPDWIREIVAPGERHTDDRELMALAIAVARQNIERTKGGPFAAIVATQDGEVLSVGYNQVVPRNDPTAHGEVMAIRHAGATLGTWKLQHRGTDPLKLLTTCSPCILCTGAIHWAGIPRVIAAARAQDAEALGFVEGPSGFEAAAFLRQSGVEYEEGLLCEEAVRVLEKYAGEIYNG